MSSTAFGLHSSLFMNWTTCGLGTITVHLPTPDFGQFCVQNHSVWNVLDTDSQCFVLGRCNSWLLHETNWKGNRVFGQKVSFFSGLEIVLNRLFLTIDNLQWSTGEAKTRNGQKKGYGNSIIRHDTVYWDIHIGPRTVKSSKVVNLYSICHASWVSCVWGVGE
jgi:hypothetical protein